MTHKLDLVDPTTSSSIAAGQGISLTTSGGLTTIANTRGAARYVVAPTVGQAGYTSIQTAINQAVSDGASSTTPAVIWIWPGQYTENLTLYPFVSLAAAAEFVTVIGNAVFASLSSGDQISTRQIVFKTPAGGGTAFSISGSNDCSIVQDSCTFTGTTGNCWSCSNGNADVTLQSCVATASAGFKIFAPTNFDVIRVFDCLTTSTDTASTISTIDGVGIFTIKQGIIIDSFNVSNAALLEVQNGDLSYVGNLECINVAATGYCIIVDTLVECLATSGFWITGTGNIYYSAVTPLFLRAENATKINPTLIVNRQLLEVGNLSFDGGLTRLNTNGQIWIGSTGGAPAPASLSSIDGSITYAAGPNTLSLIGTQATASQKGCVTLASAAQSIAGVNAANVITPSTLLSKLGALTTNGLLYGLGTAAAIGALGNATNGQLPIGSTGAVPVLAALTQGAGISITNGSGSITIAATGGGIGTWNNQTGATATIVVSNGYVNNRGGGVTYTLPATASLGDPFEIVGKLGAWTVAQNANQQILLSSSSSTVGVAGSVASTNVGDCAIFRCITAGASTVWRIESAIGNITVT